MAEQPKTVEESQQPPKVSFSQFIMMLSAQAMLQMGVLADPQTKKINIDLMGAQTTIEIIDMLREKTSGSLNEQEAKLVDNVLHDLRMRYVKTVKDAQQQDKGKNKAEGNSASKTTE